MKTVYICGDSFSATDPDYPGISWTEQLHVMPNIRVVNLSLVAASNLLINLQVERAIQEQADYIICLATSVTRDELKLPNKTVHNNLLDRFYSLSSLDNSDKDLVSCSFLTIENYPVDQDSVRNYQTQFFDLELSVFKNKCIIENTLQKLLDSKIPFIFDQGGFEHKSFGNNKIDYFTKYRLNLSDINIWDYATGKRKYRPFFHISDVDVHRKIALYYYNKIKTIV